MALNSSGTMSMGGSTAGQSINLELGYSATATISLNDTAARTLAKIASGTISLSDFYGKSKDLVWSGSMSRTGGAGTQAIYANGTSALQCYFSGYFYDTLEYSTSQNSFTGHAPSFSINAFWICGGATVSAGSWAYDYYGHYYYDNEWNIDFGLVISREINTLQAYYANTTGWPGDGRQAQPPNLIWFSGSSFSGTMQWVGVTTATITGSGNALVGSNAWVGTLYLS